MASNYNEEESEQLESYNFTPSRTPKPSRRQFNPSFKCDVIRRVDRGESINLIATELKIDHSQIYRWIEQRTILFQNENLDSPKLADRKQGKFPRLEAELLKFIIDEINAFNGEWE
jgi:transposase-like protein